MAQEADRAEYQRAYRQANREKVSERRRAWYQANKEKVAERNRSLQQAKIAVPKRISG